METISSYVIFLGFISLFVCLVFCDFFMGGRRFLSATLNSQKFLLFSDTSPKEFLFLMAFVVPCLSIVICYARIFYIVRKTALKTQEPPLNQRGTGSIKMTHNHATYTNNLNNNGQYNNNSVPKPNPIPHASNTQDSKETTATPKSSNGHRLSFLDDEESEPRVIRDGSDRSFRSRRILKRTLEEDLKFIDTSVESDLPPTLSSLQRQRVQQYSPIKEQQSSGPSSPLTVTITHDMDILDSISQNVDCQNHLLVDSKNELAADSAVEVSIISQDNQVTYETLISS